MPSKKKSAPAKIQRRSARLSIRPNDSIDQQINNKLKVFFNKYCDEGNALNKYFIPQSIEGATLDEVFSKFIETITSANTNVSKASKCIQCARKFLKKIKIVDDLIPILEEIMEELGACKNFITISYSGENCGNCSVRKRPANVARRSSQSMSPSYDFLISSKKIIHDNSVETTPSTNDPSTSGIIEEVTQEIASTKEDTNKTTDVSEKVDPMETESQQNVSKNMLQINEPTENDTKEDATVENIVSQNESRVQPDNIETDDNSQNANDSEVQQNEYLTQLTNVTIEMSTQYTNVSKATSSQLTNVTEITEKCTETFEPSSPQSSFTNLSGCRLLSSTDSLSSIDVENITDDECTADSQEINDKNTDKLLSSSEIKQELIDEYDVLFYPLPFSSIPKSSNDHKDSNNVVVEFGDLETPSSEIVQVLVPIGIPTTENEKLLTRIYKGIAMRKIDEKLTKHEKIYEKTTDELVKYYEKRNQKIIAKFIRKHNIIGSNILLTEPFLVRIDQDE